MASMRATSIAVLVTVLCGGGVLAGCGGGSGISGTATTDTSTSALVSSPTTVATTAATDAVKGTTFDACGAVTDSDLSAWNVDPASRRDAHSVLWGQNVRGCVWDGPQWGIKVYAVDGKLSNFETPNESNDRQERITIGARSGWLLHTKNGLSCTVVLPSQQALAAAQVDLDSDLTKQRYDQCPLAVQIATQIEPKIP
ncbi:Protein of uncharacterised function (DUF3558) [Mycobacteroides abscessus subsp. abscessus]|uniref:DUF3558 family protein n=1 Tax=Mycobacteroides abscessus TaxID=36809 RepID=UPI00092A0005|nr:DUF3558 family protein [Mycobacteroides abscessus]SHU70106.1 Protein of uncharacterised function (DUF3558) [Mycobacteroides abscessus subsp. abscessus]